MMNFKIGDKVVLKKYRTVYFCATNSSRIELTVPAHDIVGTIESQSVHANGTPSVWHYEVKGEYVVWFPIPIGNLKARVSLVCYGVELELPPEKSS